MRAAVVMLAALGLSWSSAALAADSTPPQDLPANSPVGGYFLFDDEMEFDADTLRFFLRALRDWDHPAGALILEKVSKGRLKREKGGLIVTIEFASDFVLKLRNKAETPRWQVYEVEVPKRLEFRIDIEDGRIQVSQFKRGSKLLSFKAKIPVLSDRIYARKLNGALDTGRLRIELGALGNWIVLIAHVQLIDLRFEGIDAWDSVARNLPHILMPRYEEKSAPR